MSIFFMDYVLLPEHFITSDALHKYISSLNKSNIQYIKTDFIKNRQDTQIHIDNWRETHSIINYKSIDLLVSGHSDYGIDNAYLDILNSDHLKIWYCQNKCIKHPKLFSIPLGITNKDEPVTRGRHKIIGNTTRIYNISKEEKEWRNLVYMNLTVTNFPEERKQIVSQYAKCSWVTYEEPNISENGHENYLRNIHTHKFAFAPRGNGLDTHRLWECLYLRTIPIVKHHVSMEDFSDLPILFVDSWDGLTEEYLNEQYEIIMKKKYNMKKITLTYWTDRIQDLIDANII